MREASNTRRGVEPDGFTLLELMIVVMVVAILLAVAIPSFLGAKSRADVASAKSRAVQALKTQKVLYADGKGYVSDVLLLEEAEPSLDFRDFPALGATEVKGVVYVRDVAADTVTVVARAANGDCYWARDENGLTVFAKGDCVVPPTTFSSEWP